MKLLSFSPILPQVTNLLALCACNGFEKITLKKGILRGYFIANQQSKYFETEQFKNVLSFLQANPRRTNLKEVKNTLRLSIDGVQTIDEAVELLEGIVGAVAV